MSHANPVCGYFGSIFIRERRIFGDDARARIKARVMAFLDEENNAVSFACLFCWPVTKLRHSQIAYHNETIAGKIARQDFPKAW